jgi:hypothetical protein
MPDSSLKGSINNVMCIPIARQRLDKCFPAEANAHNSTSIARQRRGEYALSTIAAVFSVRSVPRSYKGAKIVVC